MELLGKAPNINTKLNLQGHLTVVRRDAITHDILDIWAKKNVITYGATEALTRLMAPNAVFGGTAQQEAAIKSMRFGTSNLTPQRTDVNLNAEAVIAGSPIRVELLDANRVFGASGTILFVATIDAGTGNGLTYREAGLFTRGLADNPQTTTGSVLFAHQTFPDQIKTGAIELEFRWRVTFTV
jgi:hypothetical protein